MQTYEDAEGKNRTAINIVQRECEPLIGFVWPRAD